MDQDTYHQNLEFLYERFGRDRAFVALSEIAPVLGFDKRTLESDKTFPVKRINSAVKVNLMAAARWMSA